MGGDREGLGLGGGDREGLGLGGRGWGPRGFRASRYGVGTERV